MNLYEFYHSLKKRSFLYKWREKNIKLKYFGDNIINEENRKSETFTNKKVNKIYENKLTNSLMNKELEEDKVKTFTREYSKENLNNSKMSKDQNNFNRVSQNSNNNKIKSNNSNLAKSKNSENSDFKKSLSKSKKSNNNSNRNLKNTSYNFKDGNNNGIKDKNKINREMSKSKISIKDNDLQKLSSNLEFDYSEYLNGPNFEKDTSNNEYTKDRYYLNNIKNNYLEKYEVNQNSSRAQEDKPRYNFDEENDSNDLENNDDNELHYSTKMNNLLKAEKENNTFNKLYLDSIKKEDNFLYNREISDVKNREECTFIPNNYHQ